MTELELRTKFVNTAKKYLGVVEGSAEHKALVDRYNRHKPLARGYALQYDDPWCSGFASVISIECELTDIIPTEVGCGPHIELFKKLGRWVENDAYVPSPGDLVFYSFYDKGIGDNTLYPDHIGIVAYCDKNKIKVIEGNISDAVGYRDIAVNGRYIRGYAVPNFASKATKPVETTKPVEATPSKKSTATIVSEVLAGKWGNGADRKANLTAAGYDYDTVQAAVNAKLSGKKSVTEIAKAVIRGDYGNGADRVAKLKRDGYDPDEVQAKVNQLLKG